jgi:hypothetical protein
LGRYDGRAGCVKQIYIQIKQTDIENKRERKRQKIKNKNLEKEKEKEKEKDPLFHVS